MRVRRTHSTTGERFAKMSDETLRLVLRRKYRLAADTAADQIGAQRELQARRRKSKEAA